MVMHPLLNDGYLRWCIMPSHGLIFILFLSSTFYASKASDSGIFLWSYSGPYLNETSKSSSFCYIEKSSLSSDSHTVSCEDLKGIGSLNTTCTLNSSLQLDHDLYVCGTGNLEISPHVSLVCPIKGCSITVIVSGNVTVGPSAAIVAGSITFEAYSITLPHDTIINTTSLGGAPPAQTSGTPSSYDGAGGGHGGRGASCLKSNKTLWGGDVYSWSTLSDPWSFGSKGGTASADKQYGGDGGGRIMLKVNDTLYVDGSVTAEGGEGGLQGGGGSGGSIKVHALKLRGNGTISAAGGRGWGGGGGGRISLNCYSIQDVTITAHGGHSIGCPENAGAAGTVFDKKLQSLKVSNDNFTTRTETPLLDFPTSSLWSNVFVENNAKVLVPLLWTRVQALSSDILPRIWLKRSL